MLYVFHRNNSEMYSQCKTRFKTSLQIWVQFVSGLPGSQITVQYGCNSMRSALSKYSTLQVKLSNFPIKRTIFQFYKQAFNAWNACPATVLRSLFLVGSVSAFWSAPSHFFGSAPSQFFWSAPSHFFGRLHLRFFLGQLRLSFLVGSVSVFLAPVLGTNCSSLQPGKPHFQA